MSIRKPQLVGPQPEPLSAEPPEAGSKSTGPGASPPAPWMDKRKVSYYAMLALTAFALYAAYLIYRPFVKALFLALVLTIAFLPLHKWISRRVHRTSLAAIVTTTIVILAIMAPLLYISLNLVSQAASFYGFLTQKVGGNWSGNVAWMGEALQRTAEHTGIPAAQLRSTITSRVQELGAWVVGMVGWAAKGFLQQVGTAILTLVVLFFFLRDREQYERGIIHLLPLPPGRVKELSATLQSTVVANLYGLVAVGVVQGALTGLGWWMAGLRAPVFWGAIATIFSFIPLVGPSLIWLPGALVLAAQGRWVPAIILFLWGFIVVSCADYLIRPRFARGRANANTLLVLLSLIGGLKAFGAIGIIAGPVILSAVIALLHMVEEERQHVYGEST